MFRPVLLFFQPVPSFFSAAVENLYFAIQTTAQLFNLAQMGGSQM